MEIIRKIVRNYIVILIIFAVVVFFLRVAISQVIKITITRNESSAQTNLKVIAAALENYAQDNQGLYPTNISVLRKRALPYLDKNYITASPLQGYKYSCSKLDITGYSCFATPVKCGLTGIKIYMTTTGEILSWQDCRSSPTQIIPLQE
ncbi:MAG: hypothetical protein ISS44_04950 [Candidatus Omnitrophica bacterium]|nr:hypothetical protein [Candidatus Omnitrophota bacterium]